MRSKNNLNSKVFDGFNFDIGIDRDQQHQKFWSQKYSQAKNVQEMKQIDKIFQGIIKERIFGNVMTQKTQLSNKQKNILKNRNTTNAFFKTIKASRTAYNSPAHKKQFHSIDQECYTIKQKRKISLQPLNSTMYLKKPNSKNKAFSFNNQEIQGTFSKNLTKQINHGEKSPNFSINNEKYKNSNQTYLSLFRSRTDARVPKNFKSHSFRQILHIPKVMKLDNADDFEQHFKKLSLTQNIFLYDIKLSKQTLISKVSRNIDSKLIEYFLYFFGFPSVMNFRQFKNSIQKAFNSNINLIYFFTFRILDQSANGCITISDLFRFIQKYDDTSYIEKEIFTIKQTIHKLSKKIMQKSIQQRQITKSLEEILLANHKLKADQVSQLLKQPEKQQINKGGQTKLTCYSHCVMALQHDVNVRLKQYQLQTQKNQSEAINANKIINDKKQQFIVQDGLRLTDYKKIFNGKRPKLFCLLVNLLTGYKNQLYE